MKNAVIAIFLILLCFPPSRAARQTFSFMSLSLNEGLTDPRVTSIFRDHSGVVWIATKNGLNSWDQSELKSYFHIPSDPGSLPDNNIRLITEGFDRKLYISTNLCTGSFDPASRRFSPLLFNNRRFQAWSYLRSDSLLLFGGAGTIYRCNADGTVEPIVTEIKGDAGKSINRILKWDSDTFIASSRYDGIWFFDVRRRTMERCPFVDGRNITNIFTDSRGRLYVSVYGNGVFRYLHDGTLDRHFSTADGSLSHDVIYDFVEKDGLLWMGTDGEGICLLDLSTDTAEAIRHIPGDSYSLPSNSIHCLYKDDNGNLWGGTVYGGLFLALKTNIRTHSDTPPGIPYGLKEPTVTALYEDADSLLWIGTDGGGLSTYDPATGCFGHFPSTDGRKVVSITAFSPQILLLSCFNDGLYLFDKRTRGLSPFPLVDSETTRREFTRGDLVNVYSSDGEIYIFGFDIYVYDRRSGQTRRMAIPSRIPPEQFVNAQAVYSDPKYLYIISYKSLLQIEKATKNITPLFNVPDNESITSACRDGYGNFWVGSDYALYRYESASGVARKMQNVLLRNIQSLAVDDRYRLWIGAGNKLLAYFINLRRLVILDETDGVRPNGYIFTPMPPAAGRNIYLGGTRGLTVIDRDITISDEDVPAVKLLSASLDGKDVTGQTIRDHSLTVPYKHSSLSFKVIVDESIPFRKHLFNFILEGGDKDRKIQTDSRKIELGTLTPGNYTLMASCNANDNWSEATEIMHIRVLGPVWQRTWFVALCLCAFVLICAAAVWQMRRQLHRRLRIELAKKERDKEETVRFLNRINSVIDANIDKPELDNHFLQNQLGLGRTSLYKKLKQATGMGTSEYITRRKIEKAETLLLNTDLSISEISYRLGFSYQRYFSTTFKKIKGMSPSQFRDHGTIG